MSNTSLHRLTFVSLALLALPLTAASTLAAECPQGRTGTDVTPPGPTMPSGVADTEISSIDLAPLGTGLAGRKMRLRRLVVQPGGVVPWHGHMARPANIYVISGAITEYRSTCSVPIEHRAGEVTSEFGQLSHWWKNNTNAPAVLISADILSPMMRPEESM